MLALQDAHHALRASLDAAVSDERRLESAASDVGGLYLELRRLSADDPTREVSKMAVEQVNRFITEAKGLVKGDPFYRPYRGVLARGL